MSLPQGRMYLIKQNDERYATKSLRRFLRHVRTIKWEKGIVYIRVSYGDGYWNDGDYNNSKDFNLALEAFLEGGI